jgi:betaine-aldehyde dehydrogenase
MPTIFDDVKPDMVIYREEIFGPVLTVSTFKNEEELIMAANDTKYGLAGSVYTEDLRKGHVIARKLKAGTVWINIHNFVYSQGPYGGYKQSGIGRELGREGLEAYLETKNVITYLDVTPFDWYK